MVEETIRHMEDLYLFGKSKGQSVLWFTVYREIFAPILFTPLSPLFSAGELKTGRSLMSQIIIEDRAQLNASEGGQK